MTKASAALAMLATVGAMLLTGCGSDQADLTPAEKQSHEEYLKGGIKFGPDGQPANAPPTATP